jgi:hypothetical protein
MRREFRFDGEIGPDGFVRHDREEVREALLDLEGAVFQLGGIVTMSSIREQIAPDQYVTTGVVMIYDSFAPARHVEPESEVAAT